MLKSTSEDLFYPTVTDYTVAADEGDTSGPPPGGAMGGWVGVHKSEAIGLGLL